MNNICQIIFDFTTGYQIIFTIPFLYDCYQKKKKVFFITFWELFPFSRLSSFFRYFSKISFPVLEMYPPFFFFFFHFWKKKGILLLKKKSKISLSLSFSFWHGFQGFLIFFFLMNYMVSKFFLTCFPDQFQVFLHLNPKSPSVVCLVFIAYQHVEMQNVISSHADRNMFLSWW